MVGLFSSDLRLCAGKAESVLPS